jgi:hypothetical protein
MPVLKITTSLVVKLLTEYRINGMQTDIFQLNVVVYSTFTQVNP